MSRFAIFIRYYWCHLLVCGLTLACCGSISLAQDPAQDSNLQRGDILKRQQRLAEQYKLLEEKLFTLYGYEKDRNPTRSKLLEKTFQRSQASATTDQLQAVVALLESAKFSQAQTQQGEIVEKLEEMLGLLQSENRSKRLKDEIERYQEYLKEVEQILRLQKGLRGQTEGGVDAQRVAKSQSQAQDRAEQLSDKIKTNEEEPLEEASQQDSEKGDPNADDSQTDNQSDEDRRDDKTDTPPKDSQGSPTESEASNRQPPSDKDSSDGESSAEESPNGDSPDGDSQENNAEPPLDGESDSGSEAPEANPVRERIDSARKRMKEAQKNLQEALRDKAVTEMEEAERQIAKAKKQLEEILRQKREEEVERTLAKLEERFRHMLEREIKIKQTTERLDATESSQRGTDFDVQTGKLASTQNAIAADAARALLLLADDGTSVAFLQSVEEMQQDMSQIAARLSMAKVGEFTIDLQTEVVDTLNYLVSALAKTQRDNEDKKTATPPPNGGGQPGRPGEEPLVGKIAELKMLRSLQDRIHRRHQRYSEQLQEPNDLVGASDNPELVAALGRLSIKQKKLAKITLEIVQGSKE